MRSGLIELTPGMNDRCHSEHEHDQGFSLLDGLGLIPVGDVAKRGNLAATPPGRSRTGAIGFKGFLSSHI